MAGRKSAFRTLAFPIFDSLVLPRMVPERCFSGSDQQQQQRSGVLICID